MRIYSLFDRKMREHGQLFLMNNDEAVKRATRETVLANQNTTLGRYPDDYDIKCHGVFDVERGKITAFDIPELVCTVGELFPTAAAVPPQSEV